MLLSKVVAGYAASGMPEADARLAAPAKAAVRRSTRDVFCYFDNDIKVHAPYDAAHLAAQLGVPTGIATRHPGISSAPLPPARKRASGFGLPV